MARQVARRVPTAATGGVTTGAESADSTHQDRVFVITPRPPITLAGGGVALDLPSIEAIRTGASVADPDTVMADPDTVMADVLDVIKEIREGNRRVKW